MLAEPVQLRSIPNGCLARPPLVRDGAGGWRLPRDRSGRVKLTTVELTAATDGVDEPPTGRNRRFLLARESRRWATIVDHYGSDDAAWSAAVALCRGGLITITCTVAGARLGAPTRWRWSDAAKAHAQAQEDQLARAEVAARRMLRRDQTEPSWVTGWIADVRRTGLLARDPANAESLLAEAAACLAALPAVARTEPIGRAELAAQHGGKRGAHALDDGHRLTALVLRGAAAVTGHPYPRTAAERRAQWAAAGVVCDTTSATVLVANLRPDPDSLVARHLGERADACLPTHLTARDLAAAPLRLPSDSTVFVCENPRILEATLDRGITTPIICTAGNPTTVTVDLLRQLSRTGVDVAYRGDFDWPGVSIANRVIKETQCRTWLFDTATYTTAVNNADGDLVPLTGNRVTAAWDPTLADAMAATGVAVHEELLLDHLVEHLANPLATRARLTGLR
jgi:uncharacterized protein (TIGR02679 family)